MSITKEEYMWGFETYYRGLCFFCWGFIKNKEDAEDLVQEAYIRLYQRIHKTDISTIKAFLYVTVGNLSRNYARHIKVIQSNQVEMTDHFDIPENFILPNMIRAELMQKVYYELEKLQPARKRVFKMAYIYDMKNQEIADKLNISIHTVKEHKGKALSELRAIFKNSKLMEND